MHLKSVSGFISYALQLAQLINGQAIFSATLNVASPFNYGCKATITKLQSSFRCTLLLYWAHHLIKSCSVAMAAKLKLMA